MKVFKDQGYRSSYSMELETSEAAHRYILIRTASQ